MRISTLFLLLAMIFAFSTPAHAIIVAPGTTAAITPAETEADAAAAAAAYKASLKAMTPAERRAHKKAQRKQVREAIQQYKQDKKDGKIPAADTNTLLLVILAILLPPVAVLVHQGELNSKFWIALLLTLLFYLPGLIYALLVIFGDAKKK